MAQGLPHPQWSAPTRRHTRCVSRWASPQSLSRSCLGCGGFIMYGHSCTRHESRGDIAAPGAPYCAPRTRSSPTMPLGLRGSTLVRCGGPPAPGGKAAHATRQTSAVRRGFVLGKIRVWPAEPLPREPCGYWGTRHKPWPASTRPWRWRTRCRIPIVWRVRGVGGHRLAVSSRRAGRVRAGRGCHRALDQAGLSTVGGHGHDLTWVGAGHAGPGRGGDGTGPPGDRRLAGHRGSAECPIFLYLAGGRL